MSDDEEEEEETFPNINIGSQSEKENPDYTATVKSSKNGMFKFFATVTSNWSHVEHNSSFTILVCLCIRKG